VGAVSLPLAGLAMVDGALAHAALFLASAFGFVARALKKPIAEADTCADLFVGGKRA